jgi:hypothetical protein
MTTTPLRLDQLLLDTKNPRIDSAASSAQREVLQMLVSDQGDRLGVLAESIVEDGLSPMDRLLVVPEANGRYIVVEGNRRLAALKLLSNPALLNSLDIPAALRRKLQRLAGEFDLANIEPIECFVLTKRADAQRWLVLRHTGANGGKGVVDWSGLAAQKFRGDIPALQALEYVREHGALSPDQLSRLPTFKITTLDRLLSTKSVRAAIGVDVQAGKLITALPSAEVLKPLRKMVVDILDNATNVTKLKSKEQQLEYVTKFGKQDRPDLSTAGRASRGLSELEVSSASKAVRKAKRVAAHQPDRKTLIPRTAKLNIEVAKIATIASELKSLHVDKYPHAISVMFRVFLELSIDAYLGRHSIDTHFIEPKGGKKVEKKLAQKLDEVIGHLVLNGTGKDKDFLSTKRALSVQHSPLYIDLLHAYVHNSFVTPKLRDLISTWDDAEPLFRGIWP